MLIEYDCDLCGSNENTEIPGIRQYTAGQPVHVCKNCGLVFSKTRRSPDEMAQYWSEFYKKGAIDAYDPERPIFVSRYAFVSSFLEKNIIGGLEKKKIFDVGIGEGQFLQLLRKKGGQVSGIESSPNNSKLLAQKNIPHFKGTIEDYSKQSEHEKFEKSDLVTMLFVLQNSQSATEMIKAAFDQLKLGGLLLVVMGSRILVPFKKPIGAYFHELPQDVQPYHFSILTLHALLSKCCLRTVKVSNYWDDDLLCVLARKEPLGTIIPTAFDNSDEILEWFKRWQEESRMMNSYIRKIPEFNYSPSPTYHTFYRKWLN
jgi:2-polyprenyl-3-methyl-5-hydroxy-6-metoxy-1,4-benzoquinol methylase